MHQPSILLSCDAYSHPNRYRYTIGDSLLSSKLRNNIGALVENPTTALDQATYSQVLKWAEDVRDTVYADLDSIHAYMVGTTTPGALTLCSTAFKAKWATNRANAFPFDDRQYFYPITNFLVQKTFYQVNGIQ